MKQLILKFHAQSLDHLEQSLEAAGAILKGYTWLHDRVFIPRDFELGKNWPRLILRTEMRATDRPPRFALILKRHIEDSGIDIVNDTEVISYEDAAGIILQLGFTPTREVVRRRQLIDWDLRPFLTSSPSELAVLNQPGRTRFYLDKVEGLSGYFLKLEAAIDHPPASAKSTSSSPTSAVDDLPASLVHDFLRRLSAEVMTTSPSLDPYFALLDH